MKAAVALDPAVAALHARLTEALQAAGLDVCVPFALRRSGLRALPLAEQLRRSRAAAAFSAPEA